MDKKLKMNDQVLYWDGGSFMNLAEVVLVDKEHSQVKLSNGIYLYRTPGEDGYYQRSDYRAALEAQEKKRRKKPNHLAITTISRAWKYGDERTKQIWEAYCFKRGARLRFDEIKDKVISISNEDIINNSESLAYIQKVINKISKL